MVDPRAVDGDTLDNRFHETNPFKLRTSSSRASLQRCVSKGDVIVNASDAIIWERHSGAMPPGPREARPDDRLRIEL